jgi:outer membrane protein assembly factor BamA
MRHAPECKRSQALLGVIVAFGLAMLPAAGADAQTKPFDNPASLGQQGPESDIGFRQGSIVAAPIPFESPAIGSGLALGGAYLFRNDTLSDSSSLGFGGFKTSNDSQAFGVGLNLAWDEDRWTVRFLAADASLNYDLFVLGQPLPVSQSLTGGSLQVKHRAAGNWSLGGSVDYGTYTLRSRLASALPSIFDRDRNLEIARVSILTEYDTRDDSIFPTQGAFFSARLTRGEIVGLDRSGYTKAVVSMSGYRTLWQDSVFALHAVACETGDAAPFFDSCSLGASDNFRGFVSTEFIDTGLASLQAEFRGRLTGRLGYVIFAGAGAVGDGFANALGQDFLTAGGVGLRYRLSKSFPVDYAIDYAANERGENLLYVSVGQRF